MKFKNLHSLKMKKLLKQQNLIDNYYYKQLIYDGDFRIDLVEADPLTSIEFYADLGEGACILSGVSRDGEHCIRRSTHALDTPSCLVNITQGILECVYAKSKTSSITLEAMGDEMDKAIIDYIVDFKNMLITAPDDAQKQAHSQLLTIMHLNFKDYLNSKSA